jgi:predicted small secreted protein
MLLNPISSISYLCIEIINILTMKKGHLPILNIFVLLAFTLPFSACLNTVDGVGPVESTNRTISSFNELVVEVPANVTIVISDSVQCVISAQKNITDVIETTIDGDQLTIISKERFRATKPINIVLSVRSISSIRVDGSGDINSINTIKGDELDLNINGSGGVDVTAEVNDLRTKINGSGDINISGKVSTHKGQINGSGNFLGSDLLSEETKININGSGDAKINAGSMLDVTIVGSGNVIYEGTPTIRTKITGSGEVSKRKD